MPEIVFDARENDINLYSELQMLEDEGKNVSIAKELVWQRLVGYIEGEDEERLTKLREELQELTDLKKEIKPLVSRECQSVNNHPNQTCS